MNLHNLKESQLIRGMQLGNESCYDELLKNPYLKNYLQGVINYTYKNLIHSYDYQITKEDVKQMVFETFIYYIRNYFKVYGVVNEVKMLISYMKNNHFQHDVWKRVNYDNDGIKWEEQSLGRRNFPIKDSKKTDMEQISNRMESPPNDDEYYNLFYLMDMIERLLTKEEYQIFLLKYKYDMYNKDIAEIVGYSAKTIKSKLDKIQEKLEKYKKYLL